MGILKSSFEILKSRRYFNGEQETHEWLGDYGLESSNFETLEGLGKGLKR